MSIGDKLYLLEEPTDARSRCRLMTYRGDTGDHESDGLTAGPANEVPNPMHKCSTAATHSPTPGSSGEQIEKFPQGSRPGRITGGEHIKMPSQTGEQSVSVRR